MTEENNPDDNLISQDDINDLLDGEDNEKIQEKLSKIWEDEEIEQDLENDFDDLLSDSDKEYIEKAKQNLTNLKKKLVTTISNKNAIDVEFTVIEGGQTTPALDNSGTEENLNVPGLGK